MLPQNDLVVSQSMKKVWYGRSTLIDVLNTFGIPANILDGGYVLVKGVQPVAQWLCAIVDPAVAEIMAVGNGSFQKALALFSAMVTDDLNTIRMIAPTGFSFGGRGVSFEGCALKMVMTGDAYIVPLSRDAQSTGAEWTEIVALVPLADMRTWVRVCQAAAAAARMMDSNRMVMRVYNGSDVRISPMSLDDMVLEPETKASFVDDLLGFLARREWYGERKLPWTRKYLLNGPPGTGKTSLGRWASSALGMPCLGFDFTDRYADGRTFTACLSTASSMAPCILVLDDIDRVLDGGNGTGITTHSIQTSLSGMGNLDGVVIIATSNTTASIRGRMANGTENPLARRFDVIVNVPLPSGSLRAEYATRLLTVDGIDRTQVAAIFGGTTTEGWSYDDVRAAITAAAGAATKSKSEKISVDDVRAGVLIVAQRKQTDPTASVRAANDPEDP